MPVDTIKDEVKKLTQKIQTVNDFLDVDAVKTAGTKYLKKTAVIEADEKEAARLGLSFQPYEKYRDNAHVSSECYTTLVEALGFAFSEPPEIELPDQLSYLVDNADNSSNSLINVFHNIVELLLKTSRVGIAVGFDNGIAKLSLYSAEHIVNYDSITKPSFLMLSESFVSDDSDIYDIQYGQQLHEIRLIDGICVLQKHRLINGDWVSLEPENITLKNRELLNFIPVSIANISEIPLYPQARELLQAYKWTAEEGHALSYLSQPQQVQVGDEPLEQPQKGSSWTLFVEKGGNVFYLELSPESLKPIRDRIKFHLDNAKSMGVKLITDGAGVQSGESLYIQSKHRQANLISVVKEAGEKLEKSLKMCAYMMQCDEKEVIFKPSVDFIKKPVDTSKLDHLEKAVKNDTAPIEIYAKALRDAGYTILTNEEFKAKLQEQRAI